MTGARIRASMGKGQGAMGGDNDSYQTSPITVTPCPSSSPLTNSQHCQYNRCWMEDEHR